MNCERHVGISFTLSVGEHRWESRKILNCLSSRCLDQEACGSFRAASSCGFPNFCRRTTQKTDRSFRTLSLTFCARHWLLYWWEFRRRCESLTAMVLKTEAFRDVTPRRQLPPLIMTSQPSSRWSSSAVTGFRVLLECDGTRRSTGGEVKGKLANGVGSQYPSHYLGTWCIQHYYQQ